MKYKIFLPEKYKDRATDNYKFLFKLAEQRLGYRVFYNNVISWEADTDTILTFACPQHNNPVVFDPPKGIRTIGYLRDLQTYGRKEVYYAMSTMMNRYDEIISPNRYIFERLYPDFKGKVTWMQDFYAPEDRYSTYLTNPKMRCLLSGAVSPVYPIRHYVLWLAQTFKNFPLDFLGPAIYGHGIVGDKYADLLRSYFCCITGGGVFNSLVSKYFEIPAAGSLLLALGNPHMDLAGFIPGKHFVEIDYYNIADVINDVCNNPKKYEDIRREGYEFVHKEHNIEKRYEVLEQVLKR